MPRRRRRRARNCRGPAASCGAQECGQCVRHRSVAGLLLFRDRASHTDWASRDSLRTAVKSTNRAVGKGAAKLGGGDRQARVFADSARAHHRHEPMVPRDGVARPVHRAARRNWFAGRGDRASRYRSTPELSRVPERIVATCRASRVRSGPADRPSDLGDRDVGVGGQGIRRMSSSAPSASEPLTLMIPGRRRHRQSPPDGIARHPKSSGDPLDRLARRGNRRIPAHCQHSLRYPSGIAPSGSHIPTSRRCRSLCCPMAPADNPGSRCVTAGVRCRCDGITRQEYLLTRSFALAFPVPGAIRGPDHVVGRLPDGPVDRHSDGRHTNPITSREDTSRPAGTQTPGQGLRAAPTPATRACSSPITPTTLTWAGFTVEGAVRLYTKGEFWAPSVWWPKLDEALWCGALRRRRRRDRHRRRYIYRRLGTVLDTTMVMHRFVDGQVKFGNDMVPSSFEQFWASVGITGSPRRDHRIT